MEKEKMIDKYFYEPKFTAYDFLVLFSALNAAQNVFSFYRDTLIRYIDLCKQNDEFKTLTSEINLRSNGINNFSEEFDDAIFQLKIAKILYTVSPEIDSEIFIFDNIPVKELIEKRKEYAKEMITFIEKYNIFENNALEHKAGFQKLSV